MADNELRFGPVPSSDGEGYDPFYPTPTPSYVSSRLNESGIFGEVVVIAVGELGSPKRRISGLGVVTDSDTINEIAARGGDIQKQWSDIFHAQGNPFTHIQHIEIKPLS